MSHGDNSERGRAGKQTLEAALAFTLFAAVSYLGRYVDAAFYLMGVVALVIPLAWGKCTGRWAEMGFVGYPWRAALVWGLAGGFLTSLIGVLAVHNIAPPEDIAVQLAVGIPMSLFLASPFQEFFFRGWLQPRFSRALGSWGGLLVTNGLFTLWHYLAPLDESTAFPLNTVLGLLSTYAAGLVYGYAFQRTKSIIAPWLAHALAMFTFIAIGAGSYITSP